MRFLDNVLSDFIDNAPESVVKHEKQKLLDMNDEFDLIKTNLDILK